MKNNNDIKFLLAHIRKIENTTNIRILALINVTVARKKFDISNKNKI